MEAPPRRPKGLKGSDTIILVLDYTGPVQRPAFVFSIEFTLM